jgi:hypothetical protein
MHVESPLPEELRRVLQAHGLHVPQAAGQS